MAEYKVHLMVQEILPEPDKYDRDQYREVLDISARIACASAADWLTEAFMSALSDLHIDGKEGFSDVEQGSSE